MTEVPLEDWDRLYKGHTFKAGQSVTIEGVPGSLFVLWPLLAQVYGKPTTMYAVCDLDRPDQKPVVYRESALEPV